MHYKLTVIMLLVFTLLVTSKQFFGEPIHCITSEETKFTEAINSYCWIHGTYTVKKMMSNKQAAYVGVGPSTDETDEVHHMYYQWVCFVLLGQAALFYIPRYLWKVWEGGRLKVLAADLASPMVPKQWSDGRKKELVKYLSQTNIYSHNMYALRFALCEALNLINVIGQIFFLDVFLGRSFHNYGAAVAFFNQKRRNGEFGVAVDPMDQFFPKMTKCSLEKFGPSGTKEYRDMLCVLPLNIVNEKIFVLLWFWLIFLAIASVCAVIYRILIYSLPPLRTMMILGQLRYVKKSHVSKIVRNFHFGDWFVLYQLGKNLNPTVFKDLVLELSKDLEHKTIMI